MFERRLNVLAHQGNGDEDTRDTVDDGGDGSEKVNEKFESVGDSCGGELREKNGSADAEGNGDEQRTGGGNESAVNEGQSAEMFEDGIPDGGAEKMEAKFVAGESGALPQFENE